MKPAARTIGAALALGAALLLAACGEKTYAPDEVVAELNAAGAGLVLGQPLTASGSEEAEVVTLTFADDAAAGAEVPSVESHGAGAVVVLEDADAASVEFERCEAAVDFTCFRAANVVLRFTGITAQDQAKITSAIQALETN